MIATAEPASGRQSIQQSPADRGQYLKKTISASRLGLFLQCRLKFYFRYVAQIQKPSMPSKHAGSTVHAVLQNWNLARWRRQPFDVERYKLLFEAQWIALQAGAKIHWDGEEFSERQSSWFALQHYFMATPIKADEKPEAVEVSVETDLGMHGLPTLIGFIDLVRCGGRIVDFKVSGKTPDSEQVAHTNEVQLVCYSILYRDATGKKETGLELHHLVRTKTPKLIVTALPPASEQQQARVFKEYSERCAAEERELKAKPKISNRDQYGGWATGPKLTATGFFRTEKVQGKWWLVTPEGRLFFSIGMDCVRLENTTLTSGREQMFSWLPAEGDLLFKHIAHAEEGTMFNFYTANLQRK